MVNYGLNWSWWSSRPIVLNSDSVDVYHLLIQIDSYRNSSRNCSSHVQPSRLPIRLGCILHVQTPRSQINHLHIIKRQRQRPYPKQATSSQRLLFGTATLGKSLLRLFPTPNTIIPHHAPLARAACYTCMRGWTVAFMWSRTAHDRPARCL